MRTRKAPKTETAELEEQLKSHASTKQEPTVFKPNEGDWKVVISTGSTLLDLAISGTRIRGGGIPMGILIELFGPSGSGKTVLLSEIAGDLQRKGGEIKFLDPEARLNKQFAQIFDLNIDNIVYDTPDKVPQVFKHLRDWNKENSDTLKGLFTDSLAALSTDLEMDNEDGDKMGMRRAKEFSEEFRKTCRILANKKILMAASNQVRVNQNAGQYGQKYVTPGGEATAFYSSLRLRFSSPTKITVKKKYRGKDIEKVVGVEVTIDVFKSSIDEPYRKADVIIYFDYGIDDIRANLQYVKKYTGSTTYAVNDTDLGGKINDAIKLVEDNDLEEELREQVIGIWETIQSKFKVDRKKKIR